MDDTSAAYLSSTYAGKAEGYFSQARRAWIDLLPPNREAVVLELGCGEGATGATALREGRCGRWVGIEMSPAAAEVARGALSEVLVGNVDSLDLPYAPQTFDALLASEVIEHLVDPPATLRRLTALLKPGARVFVSAPNVAHWRIVLALAQGRFDYTDWGVMDRTHLRWFTPSSLKGLLEEVGVEVDYLERPGARSKLRPLLRPLGLEHLMWVNIEARGRKRG